MGQSPEKSSAASRYRAIWAKWTGWLTICYLVVEVVEHWRGMAREPALFTLPVFVGGSILAGLFAAIITAVLTFIAALSFRNDASRTFGARTPFSHGVVFAVIIGAILGFIFATVAPSAADRAQVTVGKEQADSQQFPADIPYRDGWLHRVCATAAIEQKHAYVMSLLKQYLDNNAPDLSEAQVAKIWDGRGQCAAGDANKALLSRVAKTEFYNIGYFGDVLTVAVKCRDREYKTCRYFADDFFGLEAMLKPIATAQGWGNWLQIDATLHQKMHIYDLQLKGAGYPSQVPVLSAPRQ
jgi:hypothetical protein